MTRTKIWGTAILAIACLLAITAVFSTREPGPSPRGSSPAGAPQVASTSDSGEFDNLKSDGKTVVQQRTEPIVDAVITLKVTGDDGRPISGARARCIEYQPHERTALADGRLDTRTAKGALLVTDADGVAQFPIANTSYVLYVTHENYATWFGDSVLTPSATRQLEIRMRPAPLIAAKVIDGYGSRVPRATIVQTLDCSGIDPEDHTPYAIAQRCYHEVYYANDVGEASIAPTASRIILVATHGKLSSKRWIGKAPADPVLTLFDSFELSGTAPCASEAGTSTTILVMAVSGGSRDELGVVEVMPNGSFGPASLPVVKAERYDFLFRSSLFLPLTQSQPPPAPGSRVQVSFTGQAGIRLLVRVQDETGAPIGGARVCASWEYEGSSAQTQAFTSEGGLVLLKNIRPGTIMLSVDKPGFGFIRSAPMSLYSSDSAPVTIVLGQSGSVVGRCISNGVPLRNFEVRAWQDGLTNYDVWRFVDRPDGKFRLDDLPIGKTNVVALSIGLSQSQVREIQVDRVAVTELDLDLPDSVRCDGVVVDADSAQPIHRATIQHCLKAGQLNLGAWGAAAASGLDGRFTGLPVHRGEFILLISANGYADQRMAFDAREGDSLDCGIIPLHRAGLLKARIDVEDEAEARACRVGLSYQANVEARVFDSKLLVEFGGLEPGYYSVDYKMASEVMAQVMCTVSPARVSEVELAWRPVRDLHIEVDDPDRESRRERLWLRASYVGFGGLLTSVSLPVGTPPRVDLSRVPADRMVVDIWDDTGAILATKWITSDRARAETVRIVVGGAPLVFRVVDAKKRPLPNVYLQVQTPDDGAGWQLALTTDDSGEAKTGSVETDRVAVMVSSPQLGQKWFRDIAIPTKRDESIELVLDADSTLRVLALDRDTPLRAVTMDLMDPIGGGYVFTRLVSGDDGRASYRPVADQEFRVRVQASDLWQITDLVRPMPGDAPTPVQVRRVGGVQLRATLVGSPMRMKPISIRSLEFSADVQDWVASDRVQCSSPTLTCDENGNLRIDGLPNGPYRWTAQSSSGDEVSGDFVVSPRAVVTVNVALP